MKKIIALGMLASLFNAGLLHAQEAAPTVTTAPVVTTTPAIAPTAAATDINTVADTNVAAAAAESKPPEDPVKNMIARFSFDAGIAPEPSLSGLSIPVTFQRESPAILNGKKLDPNVPRLATGKFDQGLLLESAHANLLSPSQANAEEASMFQPLNGSALTGTSEQPWEGKQALSVTTKGEAAEEGMALELKVEKAQYNGASIVPAYYVASVYLKGQGSLKLYLKDMDNDKSGEIVYVDLGNEWKRFACTLSYPFAVTNIGAKHEADWKTRLPPGTNIEAKAQLVIVATDSSKTTFYADGLQLETRNMPYARTGVGPSPHAWIPGGTALAKETIQMETKGDAFGRWRKNGSISFWFLPNWDARDGTQDITLQVMKNLMTLQHVSGKLDLAPVGIVFTPSDWQNTWHHIAITWDEEGQWMMYVDGLDYTSDGIMKRPLTTATDLSFGSVTMPEAPNGMIDDLMLFQITLTAEQVKALFAGELLKPAATPTSAVMPTPVVTAANTTIAATNMSAAVTLLASSNSPAADEQ